MLYMHLSMLNAYRMLHHFQHRLYIRLANMRTFTITRRQYYKAIEYESMAKAAKARTQVWRRPDGLTNETAIGRSSR